MPSCVVTGVWNVSADGYADGDSAWKAVLIAKIAMVALAGLGVLLHQRATTPRGLAFWGSVGGWPSWPRW